LKQEVSIFDLINAFQKVLRRLESKREDLREIFEENFTVADKLDGIITLIRHTHTLRFSDLFASVASRTEIVVTFLALLELIRLKQLCVTQRQAFGEILITRAGEGVGVSE
jgi:segregation and condensation protein A